MSDRIAIVTDDATADLTTDGRELSATLTDRGFDPEAAVWNDPDRDWRRFDAAVIRSCFRYYTDPDGFRAWLRTLEDEGVTVLNPPDVVRWNLHKSYLLDLAECGVPVVPTECVENGSDRLLASVLRDRGWDEAVVKPAIGTSSAGVWKTSLETAREDQARFERPFPAARRVGGSVSSDHDDQFLSERDAIVQEFVPEVADGELSLVFFAGEYSHAWRSFRADDGLGVDTNDEGVPREYVPSPETVDQATQVLRTTGELLDIDPEMLSHARVDCVHRNGEFRLMELELVEPYLDFDQGDDAANALASAVESVLERRTTSDPDT